MRELKLETSKKNYTITNSIEEKNIYIQIYIYIPLSIDAQKKCVITFGKGNNNLSGRKVFVLIRTVKP